MPEIALRFGVTNGAGLRGATWKLWTVTTDGKFDVYLVCRALGSALKASLHQSGQWHIAYTEKAFENQVRGAIAQHDRRFIETWPRPAEIAPGLTLAYLIVTPSEAVTSPLDPAQDKKIIWISQPGCGHGDRDRDSDFEARRGVRAGRLAREEFHGYATDRVFQIDEW